MSSKSEETPSSSLDSGHELPVYLFPSPHKHWWAKNFGEKFRSESMVPPSDVPDSDLCRSGLPLSCSAMNGVDGKCISLETTSDEFVIPCATPATRRRRLMFATSGRRGRRRGTVDKHDQLMRKNLKKAMKSIDVVHSTDSDSDELGKR